MPLRAGLEHRVDQRDGAEDAARRRPSRCAARSAPAKMPSKRVGALGQAARVRRGEQRAVEHDLLGDAAHGALEQSALSCSNEPVQVSSPSSAMRLRRSAAACASASPAPGLSTPASAACSTIEAGRAQGKALERALEGGGFAHAGAQVVRRRSASPFSRIEHLALDALVDQEVVELGVVLEVALGLARSAL